MPTPNYEKFNLKTFRNKYNVLIERNSEWFWVIDGLVIIDLYSTIVFLDKYNVPLRNVNEDDVTFEADMTNINKQQQIGE